MLDSLRLGVSKIHLWNEVDFTGKRGPMGIGLSNDYRADNPMLIGIDR